MVRRDIRAGRLPAWVEPAGPDARVPAAPDIGGQAVSHHQGGGVVKAGNGGEAGEEKGGAGLMEAYLLGDKNVFSIKKKLS